MKAEDVPKHIQGIHDRQQLECEEGREQIVIDRISRPIQTSAIMAYKKDINLKKNHTLSLLEDRVKMQEE